MSPQAPAAVVVAVDVDEAVALGQLGGGGADEVDAAPGGVAEERYAVEDGLVGLADVGGEVVDAVAIVDGRVAILLDEYVLGAEAVFYDEERLLPALPVPVEDQPQALGVDLPAPLGGLKAWVLHAAEEVAGALLPVGGGGLAHGHIVAE